MTHDEMIALIEAHRDGKTIEFRDPRFDNFKDWQLCRMPTWNFQRNEYRIKPEPLTLEECWDKAMELTKTAGGVLEEFLKQAKENGHV